MQCNKRQLRNIHIRLSQMRKQYKSYNIHICGYNWKCRLRFVPGVLYRVTRGCGEVREEECCGKAEEERKVSHIVGREVGKYKQT